MYFNNLFYSQLWKNIVLQCNFQILIKYWLNVNFILNAYIYLNTEKLLCYSYYTFLNGMSCTDNKNIFIK